ncbi:MAG: (S)-ureidoglycine aminohydrolase [Planctomycetota bacterium]
MQDGQTRTVVSRQYAVIGPDSHVVAPLVGWQNTMGVVLIAPPIGSAGFTQYLALLTADSAAGQASAGFERFIYCLEGKIEVGDTILEAGGYAWVPPDAPTTISGVTEARAWVHEQPYRSEPGTDTPPIYIAHERDAEAKPFMEDPSMRLAKLLPEDTAFDLEINRFTFDPGASLPLVESHVNEHGLLMIEGGGIYRLGTGPEEHWQPVAVGDAIWMGAFCPQWFGCLGKEPAAYLYSKNVNRFAQSCI